MLPSVRRTRTWPLKKLDHLDSIHQGLSMICPQSSLDVTGPVCSKRFAGFSAIFVSMRYQHCRETPTKPSRRFSDGVGASGLLEPASSSVADTFGDRENSPNRPHAELP